MATFNHDIWTEKQKLEAPKLEKRGRRSNKMEREMEINNL